MSRQPAGQRAGVARWWAVWEWCWARYWHGGDRGVPDGHRCLLVRGHLGRHACAEGRFGVRYFDTPKEGTP